LYNSFLNFLVIPTYPKKLSKNCTNFLNALFGKSSNLNIASRSSKEYENNKCLTAQELLEHEFFSSSPVSPNDSLRKSTIQDKSISLIKLSNNSTGQAPTDNKNKLVNILHTHNPNIEGSQDNNHMFTVSMTVSNIQSNTNSITNNLLLNNTNSNILNVLKNEDNNANQIIHNNTRKIILRNNDDIKEVDPAKENSPNDKNNEHHFFNDFDSGDENSYNFVHEANKSIIRQSMNIADSIPVNYTNLGDMLNDYNKFNNFNFDILNTERNRDVLNSEGNQGNDISHERKETSNVSTHFTRLNQENAKISEIKDIYVDRSSKLTPSKLIEIEKIDNKFRIGDSSIKPSSTLFRQDSNRKSNPPTVKGTMSQKISFTLREEPRGRKVLYYKRTKTIGANNKRNKLDLEGNKSALQNSDILLTQGCRDESNLNQIFLEEEESKISNP
jgi:hypothetical protein